ncbi:unnamed protein product [Camellia sinensis]
MSDKATNQEFRQSVKELKEKAEELKGVTEDLKTLLMKALSGELANAEPSRQLSSCTSRWMVCGRRRRLKLRQRSVSANLKEKISAATEEVKETLGVGKQEYSEFSAKDGTDAKNGSKATFGEENQQKPGSSDTANTLFGKFKSSVSSVSPKVSVAFQKLKEAKPIDLAKEYDIVKDELSSNPNKRKRIEYGASSSTSSSTVERSTSTDVAVVTLKQSKWSKKWEAFKEKMQGHPIFKRMSGLSEPVVVKSQEFAEDIRDRWDTTDNPLVHKIQGFSETVFGETSTALSFKEIRRRDPSFSLPEFVAEVEEVIKPVLNAYFKGDAEVLKKYCSNEVIERCKAEHKAFKSQGVFFDNKSYYSDVWLHEDPSRIPPHRDEEVCLERKKCLKRFFDDPMERIKANLEYAKFSTKEGPFADIDSIRDRCDMDPHSWWVVHGASAPTLQSLVLRLLVQPSSSSCAERNWSIYSFIHSMRRNKMTPQRVEDLVFVHSNLRLLSRRTPQYLEGETKLWDIAGDTFDSFDDVGMLEVANLSLDEPEMEVVLFTDDGGANEEKGGDANDDEDILHISDVEVRETKMMGDTPIIIVVVGTLLAQLLTFFWGELKSDIDGLCFLLSQFQTQQVYCVRDRNGSVTEGGQGDTIHTVYYAWAMQQVDVEELGEGALFPIWRPRELQQLGVKALI